MKKQCPYSNEYFEQKRTNQRFASSKNRISYHNDRARAKRTIKGEIDYLINNNWNILLKLLLDKNKITRSKEFMLGAGFNFNYYQRTYREDGQIIYRIYNCGFSLNEDYLVILKLDL
jgi:hypothetical protein